ncbi:hypothetical protein ECC02_001198 [Trypanosoma cruzi]|uniref:Uncharacterized protein n=1 Tax=Trypanosoma cruzi TaxID=5693 RepID=A0A7J6YH25_TRYCR|nr:hypothetical protein ECC02_001198 [Trypanosoma cruzi]
MPTCSSMRCGFDWRRCKGCSWQSMGRQLGAPQHSARPVTSLHRFCHGKKECVPYGRDNRKILQIHDVPEGLELLLGPRGTQGPKRGIRGKRGFVRRIAVAPFDGVLKCMMDATPAAPGPGMQTAVRGTVRPGRAPLAGERCLWNLASCQGDCVHSVTWIVRTVNNDAGVRVEDIQGAVEMPRNGTALSPRRFREQTKSMPHPRPMKHDAANVVGLDNATRRAE